MRRRRGITLIEVLVAIFIMAIGLLAILTLFPLGALRMAEALQDDRAAASASAGANTCDAFGIRNDPTFLSSGVNLYLTPPAAYNLQAVAQGGSGYPLYVDPWGLQSGDLNVVGVPPNAFPRVAPTVIPPPYSIITPNPPNPPIITPNPGPTAIRYFSLPDDMTFYDNGAPDTGTPPGTLPIQRGGRYTWAYLLHRSQPASSTASVDLTVVVYAGRATSVPGGENTFAAVGTAGDTKVSLSWVAPQQAPNIKRGSWILDTSRDTDSTGKILYGVHGLFYRVVSVSQPSNNTMNLEVQTPLVQTPVVPNGINSITVLDNVVEVFSRGVYNSSDWEFRNEQ